MAIIKFTRFYRIIRMRILVAVICDCLLSIVDKKTISAKMYSPYYNKTKEDYSKFKLKMWIF